MFFGDCRGRLARVRAGSNGFGYDPVFIPDATGDNRTMAELTDAEKDAISHRGHAARAFMMVPSLSAGGRPATPRGQDGSAPVPALSGASPAGRGAGLPARGPAAGCTTRPTASRPGVLTEAVPGASTRSAWQQRGPSSSGTMRGRRARRWSRGSATEELERLRSACKTRSQSRPPRSHKSSSAAASPSAGDPTPRSRGWRGGSRWLRVGAPRVVVDFSLGALSPYISRPWGLWAERPDCCLEHELQPRLSKATPPACGRRADLIEGSWWSGSLSGRARWTCT